DGVLDATLQDDCIALVYADRYPNVKFVERPVGTGLYVGLLKPGEDRLLAEINEALGHIMSDGRLEDLYDRWDMSGRGQMLALRHVSEIKAAERQSFTELLTVNGWTLLK